VGLVARDLSAWATSKEELICIRSRMVLHGELWSWPLSGLAVVWLAFAQPSPTPNASQLQRRSFA